MSGPLKSSGRPGLSVAGAVISGSYETSENNDVKRANVAFLASRQRRHLLPWQDCLSRR